MQAPLTSSSASGAEKASRLLLGCVRFQRHTHLHVRGVTPRQKQTGRGKGNKEKRRETEWGLCEIHRTASKARLFKNNAEGSQKEKTTNKPGQWIVVYVDDEISSLMHYVIFLFNKTLDFRFIKHVLWGFTYRSLFPLFLFCFLEWQSFFFWHKLSWIKGLAQWFSSWSTQHTSRHLFVFGEQLRTIRLKQIQYICNLFTAKVGVWLNYSEACYHISLRHLPGHWLL